MNTAERLALWYRLRTDPDYEESWLRFMGPKPPEPESEHTEWGDGHRNQRVHLIEDISFAEGRVDCTCGDVLHATVYLTTEDVWDKHRGADYRIEERALEPSPQWASDEEVAEFLARVAAEPHYVFEAA